ncbi:4-(cytidine 5'-diphospho)-2-C-methyl-D-erythritol kinase [Pseudoruegeria sp. SHC-113]|uniref:4-(cytidine 5'-diphospho)-2-C-methyl-D-erythritol kinase n=1 Tax=Pseudoruegeria sp. SHC-113 TaxID=2855439 RepID=UPI0021BACB10|nr:4-(cytidine 5'-diphospho)-2-C-methyl-D-erythritol kinase [Pseudoruegeria sp. SHC-113]MCT8158937.1 4-(cytidine 5'-diphospho)-2-C-methyl-D-erythritol kinase [Pseudoruegeria sp. SHC-113]
MTVREFAPAKVNLTLHVTGRRPDRYHLLDSFVVFASVGDWVRAEPAPETRLAVSGPRAEGVPVDGRNLVLKAAALLPEVHAGIMLEKHLPAAAGIGGGSSDAAATLRALARLGGAELPPAEAVLALGADVPVCLAGRPCRMEGIGERVTPLSGALPEMGILLVNPGVDVPTPKVFAALDRRDNPPMPEALPVCESLGAFTAFLAQQRNDLEAPARALEPVIGEVLAALAATDGCSLARMSGSGATCFGLYENEAAAQAAAKALQRHVDWWVAAGNVLP